MTRQSRLARLGATHTLAPLTLDGGAAPLETESRYPQAAFERDVARIGAYIAAGDTFQTVLFLCFDLVRQHGFRKFLASRELLLLSPLFGIVLAAFIATGEPRYRVPFDGFLMILAVELYRRSGLRSP